MNVVFLDIDGVVNTYMIDTKPFNKNKRSNINRDGFYYLLYSPEDECVSNRQAVMCLNKLCKETDSKIVIISDWKKQGLEKVKNALYNGGLLPEIEIIGQTPCLKLYAYPLKFEILEYLKTHEGIDNYVIISDDINDDLDEEDFGEHIVKTNTYVGFTFDDYLKATEILNKKNLRNTKVLKKL